MTNTVASRIPREVICEILSHLKSILLTRKLEKFPWYLGHICAAWRAEFLPLCNTISIEFFEQTPSSTDIRSTSRLSNHDRTLNVLRWYLDQNSNIPFSFTFCLVHLYTPALSAYVRRALIMLCEQSTRWLDAGLCIFGEEIDVLYQVKNRIPLLQTLMLRVGSVGFQADPDTFSDAPVLSKLRLDIRVPWNFNFPWTSLTSLSFDLTVEDFKTRFDVLSETVNLGDLTLYGMYLAENTSYDKQVILPCLRHLFISGIAALEILRAPALVHLYVDAPKTKSFSTIVESFFRASGCKLQQLETRLDSTSFMVLVKCTPDLQRLRIDYITDFLAVLQNLTVADSRTTPLSHLQSLRLDYSIDSDKHRQLCAFVKSRSRQVESEVEMSVERLRTLVIVGQDDQDWTELEKVCDECGVQLRFFETEYDISDSWW